MTCGPFIVPVYVGRLSRSNKLAHGFQKLHLKTTEQEETHLWFDLCDYLETG